MRLPFLDRFATGLHLTERAVYAVELRRRWPSERVRLRRFGREAIGTGGAAAALRRLTGRLGLATPYVYAHVDEARLRHALQGVPEGAGSPEGDEEGRGADLERRLAQTAQALLPPGLPMRDFALRYEGAGGEGEADPAREGEDPYGAPDPGGAPAAATWNDPGSGAGLGHPAPVPAPPTTEPLHVAVARREAAGERARLLEEAGLQPLFLGSALAELAGAFAFDEAFHGGASAILLQEASPAASPARPRGAGSGDAPGAGGVDWSALSDEEAVLAENALFRERDAGVSAEGEAPAGVLAQLLVYREGTLQSITPLEATQPEAALEEADHLLGVYEGPLPDVHGAGEAPRSGGGRAAPLIVAGEAASAAPVPSGRPVLVGGPLEGVLAEPTPLGAAYAGAAALALRGLYDEPPPAAPDEVLGHPEADPDGAPAVAYGLDFLAPPLARAAFEARERADATRAALLAGGLLGALLLALTLSDLFLSRQLEAARAALLPVASQLEEAEAAQAALAAERSDVARAEALARERTHAAALLAALAEAAPEGLWLTELVMAPAAPAALEGGREAEAGSQGGAGPSPVAPEAGSAVTLVGVAARSPALAELLRRLEAAPYARRVRLRYAHALSAEEVLRLTGTRRAPLERFEVAFEAPPP